MFTSKKPLKFTKTAPKDVENTADAKKPGDAKEDAKDMPAKKGKGAAFWSKKAATGLVGK